MKKHIHSRMCTLVLFSLSICFALFLSGLEGSRFEIPWLAGTHATAHAMSPPVGREKVELVGQLPGDSGHLMFG